MMDPKIRHENNITLYYKRNISDRDFLCGVQCQHESIYLLPHVLPTVIARERLSQRTSVFRHITARHGHFSVLQEFIFHLFQPGWKRRL